MTEDEPLAALKQQISALWQQREQLKSQLETARDAKTRRTTWQALEAADARLSALDGQFKQLWDAANTEK